MGSGLSDSVGTGLGPLASYAIAAVVVLVLVVVVLVVAKRFMGSGPIGIGNKKGPRLQVLDVAAVDQRRKLVLIRRDEVEHLVLIGGQNDLVVEKGIVRAPHSLRPQVGDRDDARAVSRGPAIAPQPRPAAAASPLRRTVPRPNFEPIQPSEAPAETEVVPAVAPASSPELERPQPKAAAPRPAAPPVVAPQKPLAPPAAVVATREETAQPPITQPVPNEDAVVVNAPPVRSEPKTVQPVSRRTEEASEPRIPAFLRRGDAPAVPPAERAPEPAVEASSPPEPPRMAPPLPFFQNLPTDDGETPRPAQNETRKDSPPPPMFPTLRLPPSSEPVVSPPAVEPAEMAAPIQRPLPPAASPADDTERRPLAVRSFATTIQSRRSNFEPGRSTGNGERPVAPPLPAPLPPASAIPSFLQPQVQKPISQDAPLPTPAPSPEDVSLEETLSQKLTNDFGAVEWRDDKASPQNAPASDERVSEDRTAAAVVPVAASEAKPSERPLTLEEEMERLLSDFDFSDRRR